MARNRNIEMTSVEHDRAFAMLSSKGATDVETDAIVDSLGSNYTREEMSEALKGWFKIQPRWSYSQRATWDGADDQTYADNELLNTLVKGVEEGTLALTELNGALSVEANKFKFTAQATPIWGDQGGHFLAETRVLGKALFVTINMTDLGVNGFILGWSNAEGLDAPNTRRRAYWVNGSLTQLKIQVTGSGTNPGVVDPILTSTDYELVILLGSFNGDGEPYYSGQDPLGYLFGAQFFRKVGGVYVLDWVDHKEDSSPLYPSFTNHSAAGTVKPFNVPDRDYRTVMIPSHFSSFNGVTGTSVDAVTPEVGASFVLNGLWDIQAVGATTQGAVPSDPKWTIISEINASDVFLQVPITPVAGEVGGIVFRYVDGDNFLVAVIGESSNLFTVYEILLGTWIVKDAKSMTINPGTEYLIKVRTSGTRIIAMIDDTTNTIDVTSPLNVNVTKHGLRANKAGTSFKRFIGYPLISTAYYDLNDS